ncbi:hypothetical protein AV530_016152 [Patagioenas fasciata monilis]|uniref:Uncharacterized protein n=1 Tax=Patagioenas fasciata monilis TaxID=372326 RepID=A0A1V4JWE9_PATFA|nr:hypothetical protein AV530_016152 [Patagioenas fasciata monilis]
MTIHELADTASGPPGHEGRACWDAAIQPRKEEQVQPCSDGHKNEQDPPVSNLLYNYTTTTTSRASPTSGEMQEQSWLPAESSSCIRTGCRDELKAALLNPTWSTCRALAGVSTCDNLHPPSNGLQHLLA